MWLQAAQQGDATKVDKRRKKKQKEAAEDAAFLDNGQEDDAEYAEGQFGQPTHTLPPLLACNVWSMTHCFKCTQY